MINITQLEQALVAGMREIGVARWIDPGASNPRVEQFLASAPAGQGLTDDTAWCAGFVNFLYKLCGLPVANSLWVPDWQHYGQPAVLNENFMPPLGAIVIVVGANGQGEHIGLFAGSPKPGVIYLLGGNQGGFGDNPDTPMIEENRVDIRLRMPADNWIYRVPKE